MKITLAKIIIGLAIAGIVFRLVFVLFTFVKVPISSDEALPGLMGMHILKGEFPIIYWAQAYGGTQESYFDAPWIFLLGPNAASVRIYPFFFSLVFLFFSYLLARRIYDRETGAITLLLLAIPTPYLAMCGALPPDNYMALIALGTVSLYLTHLIAYGDTKNPWVFIGLGAVLGFSFWLHLLFIGYLGVVLLFLFLKDKLLLFRWRFWTLVAAFIIMALPFIWYNLTHDFITFKDVGRQVSLEQTVEKVKIACTFTIQFILGMKVMLYGDSVHTRNLPAIMAIMLGAIWIGMLLLVLWLKRKQLWRICILSLKGDDGTLMLFAMAIVSILVFARGERSYSIDVRYLLPIMSGLPILMAYGLRSIQQWFKPLFYGLACFIIFCNLWGHVILARAWSDPAIMAGPLELPDTGPLIQFLETKGIYHAYTHYWLSYRISFETDKKITCAEPYNKRFAGYDVVFIDEVRQAPKVAFITHLTLGIKPLYFENLLKSIGGEYKKEKIDSFTVFYDFKPPYAESALKTIPRADWQVSSNFEQELCPLAIDGKLDTEWSSGRPQSPGMFFEVNFTDAPREICKIRIDMYKSWADQMRGSKVETSLDGQEWTTVFEYGDVAGGLFWENSQPRFLVRGNFYTLSFAPVKAKHVRITQTGSAPRYWWTITELNIYGY